ncbi:ribonuclease J [Sedimentibacter hydroxybenzoicus DSM 7310]|uniref:Ribonuclease J n=1 Tax=Sedimentibacter hydroxybenzoicus DSM 7310 TaxID=1123245 RepID=A0A974GXW1_SEDHY|nr:ribonuclease J [Sedimentibacter hydroxybenzoicus]NYB75968.1 ribonuclease J [Sedimentibacter hydroxybenzoicus DSM 7310]
MATEKKHKLKIIPLGGLGEIGKNMTVIEYGTNIIVVDCGMSFPEDEMLGIDIVIPDITYLIKNQDKIKGICLTHGHEDHIGSIPYLLKKINVPLYGTKLTLGLVENKLLEHKIEDAQLNRVEAGQTINLGCFKVTFIRSNHSIPDAVSFAIDTPIGMIVHTGDFKIDYTPINEEVMDLGKLAECGRKGVLLAMSDSTNVERAGFTESEKTIGYKFLDIFKTCESRIIVASFASNVHRLQQIINAAVANNRKVAISGKSMINAVKVSQELGYLDAPEGTLIHINDLKDYKDSEVVLMTTGSQGEPMSALTRMANSDHKKIQIKQGDLVIISANPIPGNEKTVSRVINMLYEKGATVLYDALTQVHVSGHARREELKLMLSLLKPKFFIPVHGEYRHLMQHAKLAEEMGIPEKNTIIGKNGDVIELTSKSIAINGSVQSGNILVDGLGVGDVGNIVLRDRKLLAENGLIIVVLVTERGSGKIISGPEIVSRGFIYVRENIDLIEESKSVIRKALSKCEDTKIKDWNNIKMMIKDALSSFIYEKIKRNPMILPIIMEVKPDDMSSICDLLKEELEV